MSLSEKGRGRSETYRGEGGCKDGNGDGNDAISHRSQAFPIATRSWKKQGGSDSHQDPPEEP